MYLEIILMKRFFILLIILFLEPFIAYEIAYKDRVYPGVFVEKRDFGNWKKEAVENFFALKNKGFHKTEFVFSFEEKIATISGKKLNWGYHPEKIAHSVFKIGRSGNFFLDFQTKLRAFFKGISLEPFYNFDEKKLRKFLADFEKEVYIPPKDARFQLENSRVIAFQKEKEGRELNIEKVVLEIKKNLGKSKKLN